MVIRRKTELPKRRRPVHYLSMLYATKHGPKKEIISKLYLRFRIWVYYGYEEVSLRNSNRFGVFTYSLVFVGK